MNARGCGGHGHRAGRSRSRGRRRHPLQISARGHTTWSAGRRARRWGGLQGSPCARRKSDAVRPHRHYRRRSAQPHRPQVQGDVPGCPAPRPALVAALIPARCSTTIAPGPAPQSVHTAAVSSRTARATTVRARPVPSAPSASAGTVDGRSRRRRTPLEYGGCSPAPAAAAERGGAATCRLNTAAKGVEFSFGLEFSENFPGRLPYRKLRMRRRGRLTDA